MMDNSETDQGSASVHPPSRAQLRRRAEELLADFDLAGETLAAARMSQVIDVLPEK